MHFSDPLPALGPGHRRALSDAYFGLVQTLLRSESLSVSPQLQSAVLALCNIDLGAADLLQLSRAPASLVSFLVPHISLVGVSGVHPSTLFNAPRASVVSGSVKPAPYYVRYASFCLLRILAYVYSSVATADSSVLSLVPSPKASKALSENGGASSSSHSLQNLQTSIMSTLFNALSQLSTITPNDSVPDPPRSRQSLLNADHAWFAQELTALGNTITASAPFPPASAPSRKELDLYCNQFLWVLLRCCTLHSDSPLARCMAEDQKWVNLLWRLAGLTALTSDAEPEQEPLDTASTAGGGATTALTHLLSVSILSHVLPLVSTSPSYAERVCSGLLDAIGGSALGSAPAAASGLVSDKGAAPQPRSELVFLYRSLLQASSPSASPNSGALARSVSGEQQSLPLSRQSSHEEKKTPAAASASATSTADSKDEKAVPPPSATPTLSRVLSDYRSGSGSGAGGSDNTQRVLDRTRRRQWSSCADAELRRVTNTLPVIGALVQSAIAVAPAAAFTSPLSPSKAPAVVRKPGRTDTKSAMPDFDVSAATGSPQLPSSAKDLASIVGGAEIANQLRRVCGAVAVLGGHLEHLHVGGKVDVAVSGRGEVIGMSCVKGCMQ